LVAALCHHEVCEPRSCCRSGIRNCAAGPLTKQAFCESCLVLCFLSWSSCVCGQVPSLQQQCTYTTVFLPQHRYIFKSNTFKSKAVWPKLDRAGFEPATARSEGGALSEGNINPYHIIAVLLRQNLLINRIRQERINMLSC